MTGRLCTILSLTLALLAGCSAFARAGGRFIHVGGHGNGGEIVASFDVGDNAGPELLRAGAAGKKTFFTVGTEVSLGGGETDLTAVEDQLIGSGFFTVNFNAFRSVSGRSGYQGVRGSLGVGTRVVERDASLALQASVQVGAGTYAWVMYALEVFAGYLPGEEAGYVGVGFSLGNLMPGPSDPGLPFGGVR